MPQVWEQQREINSTIVGAGRDKCRRCGSRERYMPQVWEQREINAAGVGEERDKCRMCESRER